MVAAPVRPMRILTGLFCLVVPIACTWYMPPPALPRQEKDSIRLLMEREHVNGMALALIEGGRVTHVAAYGRRSVERDLPLTTNTIMAGASFTKTAFAYLVLQLVDEGRLTLDTPIADLLPKPLPEYRSYDDLAGDERWRSLTPRLILTHRTGLANWRWLEEDKKLRFHFDPGARYAYSGQGIGILQIVVEQGLGLDLGREMQTRLFDRFGMARTSMSWRPVFAKNYADGYALDGTLHPHDRREGADSAGSMTTTIADQAKLWAAILRGDGLSPASRAELTRPQAPITGAHQFPTLSEETDSRNAEIGLAAGLGLVTFRDTTGPAFFKGGHDEGIGNIVVCLETPRRCAVLLSNDVRAERIYPEVVKLVLGETKMPWSWEYGWLEQ